MARAFASRRFYTGNAAESKVRLGQGQAEARPVEGESVFLLTRQIETYLKDLFF
jgi:hypothetical protein